MAKLQFQGDVCFVEIDSIPCDVVPMSIENGKYIVGHSESGHHHTIESRACEAWTPPGQSSVCYLQMTIDCDVIHERPWDTHAPKSLVAGKKYMSIGQVEYTPAGWRRVAD